MIRHLRYHEIDFEKYDICIKNSIQRKYCAEKQFLDIVANKKWELLVFNDYQAVMPIYRVRKFGFKIVVMPLLCQQLGVFSQLDDFKTNDLFYDYLSESFLVAAYSFNAKNQLSAVLPKGVNFYIPPQDFEDAFAKFKPQRRKKILKTEQLGEWLRIVTRKFEDVADFVREHFSGDFSDLQKDAYIKILAELYRNKKMQFLSLLIDNQYACVVGIYKGEDAAALLLTTNHPGLVKFGGASYLISEAIRDNIRLKTFDFEGSSISAVKEFYRGFRPETEYFSMLKNSKRSLLLNLFKLRK